MKWAAADCLHPHPLHQTPRSVSSNAESLLLEFAAHAPRSARRIFLVELIECAHGGQILFRSCNRAVAKCRAWQLQAADVLLCQAMVLFQDGQFLGLFFVTFENLGASLQKRSFPLADLVGMDFKFLSKF